MPVSLSTWWSLPPGRRSIHQPPPPGLDRSLSPLDLVEHQGEQLDLAQPEASLQTCQLTLQPGLGTFAGVRILRNCRGASRSLVSRGHGGPSFLVKWRSRFAAFPGTKPGELIALG